MFLGNVGSARRLDYTVIGTNVNIAQRLAAKSSSCRIFITETVRRDLAENDTAWTDMGEMELRGVNFPVRAYCTGGKFNC
jgi:adenylate cyclase